jgi:hypothetical protein
MKYFQNHFRRCTFWIVVVVISSAATALPQQRDRIVVNDARPVAAASKLLETRFGRVITFEDPPFAHADDTRDVTESVRRDLNKYAPGRAPRVIVPRGGEITVEFERDDPVEIVLSGILRESERLTTSATFRTEETNGIVHVIPTSVKGSGGETVSIESILDAPVEIPAQPRNGMQMLEAWRDAVSRNSKTQLLIGSAPLNIFLRGTDAQSLSSPNARDALTEILVRFGRGSRLSWQLLYDPGQKVYVINIYRVQ